MRRDGPATSPHLRYQFTVVLFCRSAFLSYRIQILVILKQIFDYLILSLFAGIIKEHVAGVSEDIPHSGRHILSVPKVIVEDVAVRALLLHGGEYGQAIAVVDLHGGLQAAELTGYIVDSNCHFRTGHVLKERLRGRFVLGILPDAEGIAFTDSHMLRAAFRRCEGRNGKRPV